MTYFYVEWDVKPPLIQSVSECDYDVNTVNAFWWSVRFVGMSGGSESLAAYVHPELKDCAKAVSIVLSSHLVIRCLDD